MILRIPIAALLIYLINARAYFSTPLVACIGILQVGPRKILQRASTELQCMYYALRIEHNLEKALDLSSVLVPSQMMINLIFNF